MQVTMTFNELRFYVPGRKSLGQQPLRRTLIQLLVY
jgi:hypothetical protein